MAKTVFDVLNQKLTELKNSSEEFLNSGGAKDFAGYKEVCVASFEVLTCH